MYCLHSEYSQVDTTYYGCNDERTPLVVTLNQKEGSSMTLEKNDYVLLSKKGFKELRRRISQLEHQQKGAIAELREIDKGSSHEERLEQIGQLAHLEIIESELAEKRQTLSRAKLIPSKRERFRVAIGSVVDLIDQQGKLFRYTLVDSIEANPSDGRISIQSPLGSSLVGKTIKDTIEWGNGARSRSLRLVSIQ
mgnify:CR=1 FL=1